MLNKIIDKKLQKLNQTKLLDLIVQMYNKNSNIKSLILRGSMAKGSSDLFSDIDLLIIVKNEYYIRFVKNIKNDLSKQVEMLTPSGWVDTNVPNFGGIGFVYLVRYNTKIIQLDIYILPEENSKTILLFKDKKTIFSKQPLNYKATIDVSNHQFTPKINKITDSYPEDFQIFFDLLLHFFMLSKYLFRKDAFLAYKYWYLTNSKLLFLIRTILDKETRDFGFYDVHRQLDKYGFKKITFLEEQLSSSFGVFNYKSFLDLFDIFISIIEEYQPHLYESHVSVINQVERYLKEIKKLL